MYFHCYLKEKKQKPSSNKNTSILQLILIIYINILNKKVKKLKY